MRHGCTVELLTGSVTVKKNWQHGSMLASYPILFVIYLEQDLLWEEVGWLGWRKSIKPVSRGGLLPVASQSSVTV